MPNVEIHYESASEPTAPVERAIFRFRSRGVIDQIAAITSTIGSFGSLVYGILAKPLNWTSIERSANCFAEIILGTRANASTLLNRAPELLNHEYDSILLLFILITISIILTSCLYVALFSNRPKSQIDRSWDMIKLIAGFFIGLLTKSFAR